PIGRVVFEAGGIARLGACALELGGSRVLLVTDPGLEKAGHPQRAVQSLTEAGLEVFVFDGVEENPETHHVAAGVEFAAANHLDPELTLTQPRTVTAVTGLDALAHAIESYVCSKATPMSRMCSLSAWRHLEPNLETVLATPDDLAARGAMQIGAHFAGMAIENA